MASGRSGVSSYSAASSAMYQSSLISTGIQRETFGDRLTQTRNWIYNVEEGRVMGRTPYEWFQYISYIVVFYVALLAMSSGFCAILYWVIGWNYPTLRGAESILQTNQHHCTWDKPVRAQSLPIEVKGYGAYRNAQEDLNIMHKLYSTGNDSNTPGIGFRPQPHIETTLIRFVKGDISTYYAYIDHIEAYIQYYENALQQGDNFLDCNEIRTRRKQNLNKVCVFDPIVLGPDCIKQQNYGFDDGQPCVLLKLNRIFDWQPEEYTKEIVPNIIKNIWNEDDPWWVIVRCDGDNHITRENMGDLVYFPSEQGFHYKYFPFRNQQGYRSPLMFLRFQNAHPGILLMMTCRAFAKNIIHDRVEQVGQVHFEVLID